MTTDAERSELAQDEVERLRRGFNNLIGAIVSKGLDGLFKEDLEEARAVLEEKNDEPTNLQFPPSQVVSTIRAKWGERYERPAFHIPATDEEAAALDDDDD